jgi:predicted DNA-binding transcriptional regulator YafY
MAQPTSLGRGKLAAAAQRAFDKLMASLPSPARIQAESIRARLHFDPSGWRLHAEDLSMLPIVQDALAQDRKLTFVYTRADGETSRRTTDPLGIVCKQASWYLVASTAKGMRTFRLSRMQDVTALALKFDRPANFDLAAHWKRSTADLMDRRERVKTTVALSVDAANILRRWGVLTEINRHPARKQLEEGWAIYEVELESPEQARFVVLGLGSNAKVLAPGWLCQNVAEQIARLTRTYQVH